VLVYYLKGLILTEFPPPARIDEKGFMNPTPDYERNM